MYLVPGLHIIISTVGGSTIEAYSANHIETHCSIHSAMNTAMVRIPTSARLRNIKGDVITTSAETSKQFSAGDSIEIALGYGTDQRTEFKGFIHRINFGTPCEIECEGYSYKLKRTDRFYKHYKNTTVKAILNDLLVGTGITIHADTPEITIDHLDLNGENAFEALELMKKNGDVICSFFINHTELYCGPKYLALRNEEVKYSLGWNTIRDTDLKYRDKESQKVKYHVTYKDKKGKTHHINYGEDGGNIVEFDAGYASEASIARLKAKNSSSNRIYEGYEGMLQAFLIPFAEPGFKGVLIDENYTERGGSYIITAVSVVLNDRGGRRISEIGPALSFIQQEKV
ncbi:MAG: hypothetical protein ACK4EY_15100 [Flavipsychrobacter sp.]